MAPADRPRGAETANVILKGTRLEGDLLFAAQTVVGGHLKGNIRCDSTLVIERGGRIEGRIEAQTIIVQGELEGTVLASQSLEIWSGAVVAGDVAARAVRVDEGAMLTANLMISANLPDRLGPPAAASVTAPVTAPVTTPVSAEPTRAPAPQTAQAQPVLPQPRPATPLSPPASFLSPSPMSSRS